MSDVVTDGRPIFWRDGQSLDLSVYGIGYGIALNDVGLVLGSNAQLNLIFDVNSTVATSVYGFQKDAFPSDINNSGLVIGQVGSEGVIASVESILAISPPSGFGFVGPQAINEAGQVTGKLRLSRSDETIQQTFLFSDGDLTVINPAPGAASSQGYDLNEVAQVVGGPGVRGMHSVRDYGRGFLYDPATDSMSDIGTLPGYQNSVAFAINNFGQVVGISWLPLEEKDSIRRAIIYDHRTGLMSDLNSLIFPNTGWMLTDAFDLNDAGQIVGRGIWGGEMHAFLMTPTTP